MTEQKPYTPENFREDLRRVHRYAILPAVRNAEEDAVRQFDTVLARVRRDAAREALDGLAATYRDVSTLGILQYRDHNYPEDVTP